MITLEALLSEIPLVARLSQEDRGALAAIAHVDPKPSGAILFREGDPSDDVWLVASGRIALSLRCPGAPELVLLTLLPGELAGWSALLDPGRRVATARVTEPAVLIRLPREALLALCEQDHDIGYGVMRLALAEVAKRLQETRLQLLDMFGDDCAPVPPRRAEST